ncbi:ArsR family transcriptional regulator [Nostoc spongiaeforme FACHB-130]|uniref:ArsR family transcriptional regulator n=1 Tax=Nostoc spongiaeforme FACHB-130 TaxID=1357510 RepID=A0ABR8FWE1_9NOSO|nr:ArsR family transcriptional regulator [Nostoc spongiaeforme]MBD2595688.1 ArsR family transcriptional regulator [Nostoc spongiaeforme FACHB-130]
MNYQESNQAFPQNSQLDILDLSDEQRQLINWITRQQKVTLAEVVIHLNTTEELAQQQLKTLITQRFIQEVDDSGLIYYQPYFGEKKKSKLSQNIWDKL